MGAVVLEQGRQHFVVGKVVNGDHFEFAAPLHQPAKSESSDTSEAVDGNFKGHVDLLLERGAVRAGGSWCAVTVLQICPRLYLWPNGPKRGPHFTPSVVG